VTALGNSRCAAAFELLRELALQPKLVEHLGEEWINAVASVGGTQGRDLLLGFVDPVLECVPGDPPVSPEDVLAARIVDFAHREPAVKERLLDLCGSELPARKRLLLARVIGRLGTLEAIVAGLNLIDDAAHPPIPWELWEQVEASFVERVSYGQTKGTYSLAARPANRIRESLFEMATKDERRKKSAFALLGQIEEWRLEHGRPAGEPRHPAFESGKPWPLIEQ
jgi:NACHT conflict system protein